MIFEARTKANKGCANSGNMEWRLNANAGFLPQSNSRIKRDVREATKYIETALVIDKGMFEKRNGSTRSDVVQDSIQVGFFIFICATKSRGHSSVFTFCL